MDYEKMWNDMREYLQEAMTEGVARGFDVKGKTKRNRKYFGMFKSFKETLQMMEHFEACQRAKKE